MFHLRRLFVRMATTPIRPMTVLPMATMGRNGLTAACSSALAPGTVMAGVIETAGEATMTGEATAVVAGEAIIGAVTAVVAGEAAAATLGAVSTAAEAAFTAAEDFTGVAAASMAAAVALTAADIAEPQVPANSGQHSFGAGFSRIV
jgi:hypothetical protein